MTNDLLSDSRVSRLVELALLEDTGMGDITSDAIIAQDALARGELRCKQDGVLAGLGVAGLVFTYCDPGTTLQSDLSDGSPVHRGDIIARIDGNARAIVLGERTALNFLQRMSGIATLTRRFVDAVTGTHAKITDTRKTAPGLRVLDKWAVRLGGGINHRYGLDDMVLIKDNHIVAAGGISVAVEQCRKSLSAFSVTVPIEVETKNLDEVREALACPGIQRIMLDNFALEDMRRAVDLIHGSVEVEASGGVTLETVRSIAETGVDLISVGALTHSVQALDISLELSEMVR